MPRTQLKRWVWTITLLLLTVTHAQAEPRQILIPAVGGTTDPPSKLARTQRVTRTLWMYLHDRFGELEEVRPVSEGWAGSLLFEVAGGKRVSRPERLLADIQAFIPVAAALSSESDGPQLSVKLHTAKGIRTKTFDVELVPGDRLIREVAAFLAEELKLSAEARKTLTEARLKGYGMMEACYQSRRLGTVWIYNSGEARVKLLRPFVEKMGAHPLLADAVLSAGEQMSADRRKPENPKQVIEIARLAVSAVLATGYERTAYSFLRRNKYFPELVEENLLEIVRPLTKTAFDKIDEAEEDMGGFELAAPAPEANSLVSLSAGKKTIPQQAGAIRCLGVLKSKGLLKMLSTLQSHRDARVRAAVAFALGQYGGKQRVLSRLARDKNKVVGFHAAYQLWKAGEEPQDLLELTRAVAERPELSREAAAVLGARGTTEDEEALARLAEHPDTAVRIAAVRGLMRLQRQPERLQVWLRSGSERLVTAVSVDLPRTVVEETRERLIKLANDPHGPVAEAARRALARFRPDERWARMLFDLQTEHYYMRRRIVDRLAESADPRALGALREATGNLHPHVRAHALEKLAAHDKEQAAEAAARLLTDAYRWVRVHAAATAAEVARPEQAGALQKALADAEDRVMRLYLQDALARIGAGPKPRPLPAVHRYDPERLSYGLCGYSERTETSPIGWYYCLNVGMAENARRAHGAGKLYMGRVNTTAKNPCHVLFHPIWRDLWWLNMEKELEEPLEALDGIVIGEESMYARPWQLWQSGWRMFCLEAGIDPERIGGDRKKLNKYETRAWLHWEEERAVDGFNIMYDYVKLYYGRLRPGFLVGTYMPDQNGPSVADRRWKFDVGGAYYYQTANRVRYNMIRRMKTLWPDRPVQWLVMGNVGTSFYKAPTYNAPVPAGPLQGRTSKAYADSVSAWLAGADPGFFVHWLFVHKDMRGPNMSGSWCALEEIYPGSKVLEKGIKTAFGGVEEMYRFQSDAGKPDPGKGDILGDQVDERLSEVIRQDPDKDPIHQRVLAEKERLRVGFNMERKLLFDIARVFTGLPRPTHRHEVMWIGEMRRVGFHELASDYDFLTRINQLAAHDLGSYRFLGFVKCDRTPLQDATIAAVTDWLRRHPGLLYVRGTLPVENDAEASTPEDHDGVLQEDWPWEKDVLFKDGHYEMRKPDADVSVLGRDKQGRAQRVLWRKRGFKGAVLFDSGGANLVELRGVIEGIRKKHGIGADMGGPVGLQKGRASKATGAAVATKAPEAARLEGVELLTGEPEPVVGPGRSGAIVIDGYQGRYVASYNGVRVLCEQPIISAEPVPNGLRVRFAGLLQAGSTTGAVQVKLENGESLPTVKAEDVVRWMLFEKTPGMAVVPVGRKEDEEVKATVTILRHDGSCVIRRR